MQKVMQWVKRVLQEERGDVLQQVLWIGFFVLLAVALISQLFGSVEGLTDRTINVIDGLTPTTGVNP